VLTKDGPIALCPGSRLPVLRRNLPAWLRLLDQAGLPADTPLDVVVPPFLKDEADRIVRRHAAGRAISSPGRAGPRVRVRTDAAAALAHARRALAFPGTITLELARNRVATLVLALLDPLTYALGKRLLAGRHLALPNLILGESLFPEWAGPVPGPDPAVFRALWEGLATPPAWERDLAVLEARLGAGDGASVAAAACLSLKSSQISG
jgi:lipid A disaccharide synthetase